VVDTTAALVVLVVVEHLEVVEQPILVAGVVDIYQEQLLAVQVSLFFN
jgi:hypothetical protein